MKFVAGKKFVGVVLDTPDNPRGPKLFVGVGSRKAAKQKVGA